MRRQAGFTLLEVLIASVLLAVMMALLLAGMRLGADSWSQGERLAERATRMLVVDNFFRSHLNDVKPIFEASTDPRQAGLPPKLAFSGESDWLEYAGTLPPQVRGGLYKFRLYLHEDHGRSDLKLAIRPFSGGGQDDAEPIEDVLVAENVESLRLAYYKKVMMEGGSEWLESWRDNFLPTLIRVEVTLRGEPPGPAIVIAPRAETGQ
ncbi:MAG: prepilin-type N-terminal cleavage/methylation domain-containing protein [Candidatus Methylumidiphilus sp.]